MLPPILHRLSKLHFGLSVGLLPIAVTDRYPLLAVRRRAWLQSELLQSKSNDDLRRKQMDGHLMH